jgi:hypothetical protein
LARRRIAAGRIDYYLCRSAVIISLLSELAESQNTASSFLHFPWWYPRFKERRGYFQKQSRKDSDAPLRKKLRQARSNIGTSRLTHYTHAHPIIPSSHTGTNTALSSLHHGHGSPTTLIANAGSRAHLLFAGKRK